MASGYLINSGAQNNYTDPRTDTENKDVSQVGDGKHIRRATVKYARILASRGVRSRQRIVPVLDTSKNVGTAPALTRAQRPGTNHDAAKLPVQAQDAPASVRQPLQDSHGVSSPAALPKEYVHGLPLEGVGTRTEGNGPGAQDVRAITAEPVSAGTRSQGSSKDGKQTVNPSAGTLGVTNGDPAATKMAGYKIAPEDCHLALYLFEHFSPEVTPYPRFTTLGKDPYISAPEWAALVQRSQQNRHRASQPVRWLSNGWFTSMLKRGYTLAKVASDYLVFPGCSLLLTTGEWLLGKTSTEQWIVGLTASIPFTQLLPLWWEPAKGIFSAIPQASAAGAADKYLQQQLATNLLRRCDPAQLQMAYRVTWDKGPFAVSQMSRSQIADVMVDIGIGELKSRMISAAFGLDEKPIAKIDLLQEAGNLQSSGFWSALDTVI